MDMGVADVIGLPKSPYSKMVDYGLVMLPIGDLITNDIATGLRLPYSQAEEIKKHGYYHI